MMTKDHKRKAVAIAPATVTARDGEIVVVVPDVLGKNASHKHGSGVVKFMSEQAKAYRSSVERGVRGWVDAERTSAICGGRMSTACDIEAHDGAWRLEVIGVWPTQNHEVGFVAPRGDADAAIPQALDALQHAGILDDDARVVEVRAWNLYRRGVRATVMRLERLSPMGLRERDAAIVHLLPLVPPAVAPPSKPAKSRRKVKS